MAKARDMGVSIPSQIKVADWNDVLTLKLRWIINWRHINHFTFVYREKSVWFIPHTYMCAIPLEREFDHGMHKKLRCRFNLRRQDHK